MHLNKIYIQVFETRINRSKLEKGQIRTKLSAIFKRCSHIETLKLFNVTHNMSLINELLGNVTVNHLSVDKETVFNAETR